MDKRLDHPGVERAWAKQRNCRDNVLEARGLELRQEAAHTRAFHLEDANGVAARQQLIALGIVEIEAVQIGRRLAAGRDDIERVFDQRQVLERQEVELDQPDLLDTLHRILGDRDGFLVALLVDVERHHILQRNVGNHDARGMPRSMAQQSFELERVVEKFGYLSRSAFSRGSISSASTSGKSRPCLGAG